ncbi:MAG TPA: DUF4337 domain-containing protein [Beijerinckiaceae bacterium]|nr:DUF4337 domain-containing protein [Beijerinckiaceae bacterium]
MSGMPDAGNAGNKWVALMIAALALFLAFAEAGNSNNENLAIDSNIEASNLWAFFQAKTIRGTVLRTAVEQMELDLAATSDSAAQDRMKKRIDSWKATIARYDSEPETNEGRKELAARAKAKEETRTLAAQKKEIFELAAKLFQIGIVLASAMIITGMAWLAAAGGLMGIGGAILMGFALWAPNAIHLPF